MSGGCFGVVALTYPWTDKMRHEVGNYGSKELADRVASTVVAIHGKACAKGIKTLVEERALGGRVKLELDFEELAHLEGLKFRIGEDPTS
ncbi:MAG: hypothetical protein ACK5MA_09385 [Parachlamydiaceae bacterium]